MRHPLAALHNHNDLTTSAPYSKIRDMSRAATAKKFKLEKRDPVSAKAKAEAAAKITRVTEDECIIKGETLTKGREFQIAGSRDRYIFQCVVIPDDGGEPWVDCWGVKKRDYRAFHVSRISKVIPLPKVKKSVIVSGE